MKKKYTSLFLFLLFLSSFFLNAQEVLEHEIEQRFVLIGDAGNSSALEASEGLKAFSAYIEKHNTSNTSAVFLGDNIYPNGMPSVTDKTRKQAELRLQKQLDILQDFKGNVLFIPGNHDWYAQAIKGLKAQKTYIEENLPHKQDTWAPTPGCGLEVRAITTNISMLILDSQWYLENWDKHPTINDDCEEHKTRESVFTEIESVLKKNQNKTLLIALHHPLVSNGVHGGNFSERAHLFPFQKNIPLPGIASLAVLLRKNGGVINQDIQNEKYSSLVNRIYTLSAGYDNVIFVSGHEHNLQYIAREHVRQIISGAGSKESYAKSKNASDFAYSKQGFAVLEITKNKEAWLSFYAAKKQGVEVVFKKKIIENPLPKTFEFTYPISENTQASVYDKENTQKSKLHSGFWGEHYRKLYGIDIEVKQVKLDTLFGGVEIVRAGGGHQTRSLRLRDREGKEYNMRALKKSAVQFLQTVAFKEKVVTDKFENTLATKIIEDFYTSSHPYAFTVVPKLSKAANVLHTTPLLFYIPKQKALGVYNEDYGDELYMIVQRPEENWIQDDIFGKPNKDIVSTESLFKHLRRDEKYKIDEANYIRARVFDMFLGDWDRHKDQWRWTENKNKNGEHIFNPIPRDRDQVFSNYDGFLFGALRMFTDLFDQFGVYGKDIHNLEWFNTAAINLDHNLIQNATKADWLREAKYLQSQLSDAIIDEAFKKLPQEIYTNASTKKLIEKAKLRRDNLQVITERYYKHITKLGLITGTDKDDFIDITRLPNGETNIKVYRNKKGKRKSLMKERTFKKAETKEIWVYALDDDDVITVKGQSDKYIKTRIIGGQNNDVYHIENPKKIRIYDHKTKPNTFGTTKKSIIRRTDDYNINLYDKDKKVRKNNLLVPAVGFNPDDGLKLGLQHSLTTHKFFTNPFSVKHQFTAGYFFDSKGITTSYQGEFAKVVKGLNLQVSAHYTNPNYATTFFGYGNNSVNENRYGDKVEDYNRIRISRAGASIGLVKRNNYNNNFAAIKLSYARRKVDNTTDRYFSDKLLANDKLFEAMHFGGIEAHLHYENFDSKLTPGNALEANLIGGVKQNLEHSGQNFAYIKPKVSIYNALTNNKKLVLHTEIQSQVNFGEGYQFYQAATLGRYSGLRGYRNERFTGKSSLAFSSNLRYSLIDAKTSILPFQLGVFLGGDVGRVWYNKNLDTNKWHNNFGGGIWINGAEAINGTINYFAGKEGPQFSFGFGFSLD